VLDLRLNYARQR